MEEEIKGVDARILYALNKATKKTSIFKERKAFFILLRMKYNTFAKF